MRKGLALVLALFTAIPHVIPGFAQDGTLDNAAKAQVARLLKKMGSEKYRERKEAGDQLKDMLEKPGGHGKALFDYLSAMLTEQEDPEVQERLNHILRTCCLPGPPLFPIDVNGKKGYIDGQGKVVIPPKYDIARPFSEGLAVVGYEIPGLDGPMPRDGVIDKTGKFVVPLQNSGISDFSEGLAAVWVVTKSYHVLALEAKYGFIDKTGNMVIAPQFDRAREFSEGLAAVEADNKWGYINKTGKWVIEPELSDAYPFHEGVALVFDLVNRRLRRFINRKGEFIFEHRYQYATHFSEKLAVVRVEGEKCKYIDSTGKTIIGAKFDDALGFSEGLAGVKVDDYYGYIDKTGSFVIQPIFHYASGFHEGLAAVRMGGKWGYVDKSAKLVIKPQFDEAADFKDGLAKVCSGSISGYIDKTGEFIWKYDWSDNRAEYAKRITIGESKTDAQDDSRKSALPENKALKREKGKAGYKREDEPQKYSEWLLWVSVVSGGAIALLAVRYLLRRRALKQQNAD